MAIIITPYDILTDNNAGVAPTTGGTWSYVGTGSTGAAPLPPNPPGLYDGTLDFTGVTNAPAGTYIYRYTVTSGGCSAYADLDVSNFDHIIVKNDVCASAREIVFPYNGGTATLPNQLLGEACPGQIHPTYSATATPTEWGSATFVGDLWYELNYDATYLPATDIPIVMSITADGIPYGSEGIVEPYLAVYSSCTPGLVEADVPISGSQSIDIIISDVFTSNFTYYIRVACVDGNQGKFNISVTT